MRYHISMKKTELYNTLTPHQREIFDAITAKVEEIVAIGMFWDNIISLNGPAGTGKTYLTTAITQYLNTKYDITITAPTHKALRVLHSNMWGNGIDVTLKTIHSFLNIKLFTDYDNGIQKFVPDKEQTDLSTTDVLIVDESSMISEELFGYILQAIEQNRVKAVLFVGDYYQLLPIDSNKNSVFDVRHQYKLKEIVRQAKDSYIIKVATAARNIIKSKEYLELKAFFQKNSEPEISFFHNQQDFLDDFCQGENWSEKEQVIASYKNCDVDGYNSIVRERYWNKKGISATPALLAGDQVIFQKAYSVGGVIKYSNNEVIKLSYAQKKFSDILGIEYWECKDENGGEYQEVFRVVDPQSVSLFNDKLDQMANIAKKEQNRQKRKEMWQKFFDLKAFFADVKYTFSSTIHKLQGSTYETVYIDLFSLTGNIYVDKNDLYRLLYVALTRASKDIKILIPPFGQDTIQDIEHGFEQLFADISHLKLPHE